MQDKFLVGQSGANTGTSDLSDNDSPLDIISSPSEFRTKKALEYHSDEITDIKAQQRRTEQELSQLRKTIDAPFKEYQVILSELISNLRESINLESGERTDHIDLARSYAKQAYGLFGKSQIASYWNKQAILMIYYGLSNTPSININNSNLLILSNFAEAISNDSHITMEVVSHWDELLIESGIELMGESNRD